MGNNVATSSADASKRILSFKDVSTELDEYLLHAPMSEKEPAVLFKWDITALEAFVEAANEQPAGQEPEWFTSTPPLISTKSVMEDIVSHLSKAAGGRCGEVMLAPNTLSEYGNICALMERIEIDSYFQTCMANVPEGKTLACMYLAGKPHVLDASPANRLPPGRGFRQIFQ